MNARRNGAFNNEHYYFLFREIKGEAKLIEIRQKDMPRSGKCLHTSYKRVILSFFLLFFAYYGCMCCLSLVLLVLALLFSALVANKDVYKS